MNKHGAIIFLMLLILMGGTIGIVGLLDSWIIELGIGIILSAIIAIIIQYLYRRSLFKVKEYIVRINRNDLMFDIREEKDGITDEILIEMGEMLKCLKKDFRQQVNISTQIAETSRELNTIAVESSESMESIAASTEVTCENNERQFEMLQEIEASVEGIVATLRAMNEEMGQTSCFTSDSIKSAQMGIKEASEIQGKMAEIKEIVGKNVQEIYSLKKRSEEVTSLVELIHGITSQTNMLAINASIEAARAGEQGKGFAVVASEVSKLAGETSNISKKIEQVISALQRDILSISASMEKEKSYVEEGYVTVQGTIRNLTSINTSLEECVERVEEVNKQINQINEEGQEIVTGIKKVTVFSEEISSQVQEATAQVSLQNEKISVLRHAIDTLDKNADNMQQYITSKVMEGKMLKETKYIRDNLSNQSISDAILNRLLKETGVDVIYVSNNQGVVQYCNEKDAIDLNLFSIDKSYQELSKGKREIVTTPVKKRVEDGKLFKFLGISDEQGRIYQVGLSIDSLLKF